MVFEVEFLKLLLLIFKTMLKIIVKISTVSTIKLCI